jgi:hypothetical protein
MQDLFDAGNDVDDDDYNLHTRSCLL